MASKSSATVRAESRRILDEWIETCTRKGRVSRNTVAVGIVVLYHLTQSNPPLREEVLSPGGEIKGARSGLGEILEICGIPSKYLKEVTTRQGHQDGQRLMARLGWGEIFDDVSSEDKNGILCELIDVLTQKAREWIQQQNLKLELDRRHAPTTWINVIVQNAKGRSGGIVEQHLVGAKLEKRFKSIAIPNHPAHAADRQTEREGDFSILNLVFHVTATPSRNVILKCSENIKSGSHAILLVPGEQESKAIALAEDEGIGNELTIASIESFVALNIIESAAEENRDFYSVLQDIVQIYNRRLSEVETDLSLRIDVR